MVVAFVTLASLLQWGRRPLEVASVRATGTPSAGRPQSESTALVRDFTGDAPWALSALPECFSQRLSARGPMDRIRARLPRGSVRLVSGATVSSGNCTVFVGRKDARVERRADRFHLPAITEVYLIDRRQLAIVHIARQRGELRVYRLHPRAGLVSGASMVRSRTAANEQT